MDIEMFGKLSDAFGPSGFEEDVIRTIADYCKEFDVENDAMNNLYVRMPGTEQDSRPVIQLDAHLDACGFMVQNIQDNGCLGIIMLGGFHLTSLPAHAVWIRTRSGKMVHGIICAKPVHFMTTAERNSQTLEIEKMYVDVGATSREEVENVFGIHIGDPMMPDVTFEYDAEHEICFGKAFDNRAGCACIVDTMKQLEKEQASLAVNVVGAFAAQEEVGTRGAVVTSQIVKPDLAIVFEGSPSDYALACNVVGQAGKRLHTDYIVYSAVDKFYHLGRQEPALACYVTCRYNALDKLSHIAYLHKRAELSAFYRSLI